MKGLFQGGVIVIVVAVGLDGAKAFDPEIFSAFKQGSGFRFGQVFIIDLLN